MYCSCYRFIELTPPLLPQPFAILLIAIHRCRPFSGRRFQECESRIWWLSKTVGEARGRPRVVERCPKHLFRGSQSMESEPLRCKHIYIYIYIHVSYEQGTAAQIDACTRRLASSRSERIRAITAARRIRLPQILP